MQGEALWPLLKDPSQNTMFTCDGVQPMAAMRQVELVLVYSIWNKWKERKKWNTEYSLCM